jgi:6-phosphogluconate dehydrogenase
VHLFKKDGKHLLLNSEVAEELNRFRDDLVFSATSALKNDCPVPVMSAAVNYFFSFTSEQSSANMIQAQRDSFGAHTYERTDKPRGEYFHSNWSSSEEED